MKDVLLYMVQNISQTPDSVSIEERINDNQHDFYITCDKDDMGRIIGKKGKIIKALRRVLSIMAVRDGKRVNIVMVDNESGQEAQEDSLENEE